MADFECLKVIGRGGFGEVRLCRTKDTKEPVAIKALKKSQMIESRKVSQVWEEREAMAAINGSKWTVKLICSFQDHTNLYLVMEYLPGGDLMNLLIKKNIFT
jgi:serine/threonine kinase 38